MENLIVVIIKLCAIIQLIKAIATEWLTSDIKGDLPYLGQSTGKVFTTLVTNQINECQ